VTRHEAAPPAVRVAESAMAAMIAQARAEAPQECCGLLIGTAEAIAEARPARNLRASPTRYLLDPQAHFRAMREARERGLAVVGAYHSHPTSAAEPSETDLREASYPGFLYVIVSLAPGGGAAVRAYRLEATRARFEEIRLTSVKETAPGGSP
jgi:proteasome lid subunit RPN8/RPN11